MLEKPNIQDNKIIAGVRAAYGIPAVTINFLPLGNDASAWVYTLQTDAGESYFLKVKKGALHEASLTVPRYLKDHGIEQVVAPILTQSHRLWACLGDFKLILYPFIEGQTGAQAGMSDDHWIEFGAVIKAIHAIDLAAEPLKQLARETFVPKFSATVKSHQARVHGGEFDDPYQKELALFWRARSGEIGQLLARTEMLGRILQESAGEFVLCHADIHTFNILLDPAHRLFIVDWDETLLAPKERDLMFVLGATGGTNVSGDEDVSGDEERLFFNGYGKTGIDWVALAYYRYEWVVQELGDYGARVFMKPDVGAKTKADAVRGLMALFEPGDVVEAAYRSEETLPPELM